MKDCKLVDFVEERLSWELSTYDDINVGGIASDLARGLEYNGYCQNPYFEFDQALCCPINKRREKDCQMVSCPSYKFCMMLRKEGYIEQH